ncbi:hypothetical protein HNR26_004783 [Rhizobium rosettiformans]|uniref:Uncharacterized protein n=1 Tax=Rhizobium rosettiformans TaxID=1368430 RepID=A0A7W8MEN6_9HYPH|nr:hypothetical protein [Rhizobium rosettiformans]
MRDTSIEHEFWMRLEKKAYVEEGDPCGGDGMCNGHMILPPVENCSCFQGHAPCHQCTSNQLECEACGWQDPDWERP